MNTYKIMECLKKNGIDSVYAVIHRPALNRLELKMNSDKPVKSSDSVVKDIIEVLKSLNFEFKELSNNYVKEKVTDKYDEEWYQDRYDYTLLTFRERCTEVKEMISNWFQDIVDIVDKCVSSGKYNNLDMLLEIRAKAKGALDHIKEFELNLQ